MANLKTRLFLNIFIILLEMMDKIKLDRSLKKAEINIVGNFNSIKSSLSQTTQYCLFYS